MTFQELIHSFTSSQVWPVLTAILVVKLTLEGRIRRRIERDRDDWVELTRKSSQQAEYYKDLALKNFEAGASWKAAFEKKHPPKKLPRKPVLPKGTQAPKGPPELGHCHDPRCEARTLKLHACHDLTCKDHIHESRAR